MSRSPNTSANGPVILASGGTGGHVFPAKALAEVLLSRQVPVQFVTERRGSAFADFGDQVPVHEVTAATPAGRSTFGRMSIIAPIIRGVIQARAILADCKPRAVVGFGGYPALPTMFAAISLGLPTVIHEQNAVLGKANRLIASKVNQIALSFAPTQKVPAKRTGRQLTGNPVRFDIAALRGSYRAPEMAGELGLLIFGGSQGARILSDVVPTALIHLGDGLKKRLRVVQQARPEDLERVRSAYQDAGINARVESFFDDIPEQLRRSHLVIGRSGAGTVSELTAAGWPAVLVPYAAAADNHQSLNAGAVLKAGGAVVLTENDFTATRLSDLLVELAASPGRLAEMAGAAAGIGINDAAERLADLILNPARAESEIDQGKAAA